MMFGWFKKLNSVKPFLAVEIESGSVAVALVLINNQVDENSAPCPIIKHYHRQNFSFNIADGGKSSRDFFNSLFIALEQATKIVYGQMHPSDRPRAIHLFSGSPIFLAQIQNILFKEEKPFKVTQKLVKNAINNHLAELTEKFHYLHPALTDDHNKIIESKLMKVYANGYETANPYDSEVKELQLIHFSSLGSIKIIERLEYILAGWFPGIKTHWHSTAFALYNAVCLNKETPANLIVVSVGGLNTELIVIKDRVINEIASIPFGEQSIIQILEQKLKRPAGEIKALLELQMSAGINHVSQTAVTSHLDYAKTEWDKYFTAGVAALAQRSFLPKKLLVVGHGLFSDIILDWIKGTDLAKTTRSQSAIESYSIKPDFFGRSCSFAPGSTSTRDIHLMAEAIFCDTLTRQGKNL